MTRRPKPLLPTTTALSNKHETEIRSNILVSLVFAVGLASGGTELAPMSTTTDLKVAVEYSMSESSLLFKIKTKSFMQRGADLQYLSAFPAEKELLYPPLTFLQPTGWSMEHSVGGVKFTVIEVEPFAG